MVSSVCFFFSDFVHFLFLFFYLEFNNFHNKDFCVMTSCVIVSKKNITNWNFIWKQFKIKPIHTWSDKYYFFHCQILFIVKDTWDFQHLQKTWKDIRSIFFSFDEKKFKFCWIYQNLKEIINSSCFFYSIINFWWFCQYFKSENINLTDFLKQIFLPSFFTFIYIFVNNTLLFSLFMYLADDFLIEKFLIKYSHTYIYIYWHILSTKVLHSFYTRIRMSCQKQKISVVKTFCWCTVLPMVSNWKSLR